jgi:DNA polymerase III delta subunit
VTTSKTSEAIKSLLNSEACPSLILISCIDEVRKNRVIDAILKKFNDANQPLNTANYTRYKAQELSKTTINDIKQELFSLSLFSRKQFFLIHNIELLNASLTEDLCSLLSDIPKDSYLILSCKEITASNKISKLCSKNGAVIQLVELKGFELKRWVKKELVSFGIEKVDEQAIDAIIESCNSDIESIHRLTSHLSLYSEDNSVSKNDVSAISNTAPDPNEFILVEYIIKKDLARAELLIHSIIQSGKSPFALLGLIYKSFSAYAQIVFLRKCGLSPAQIKERLGISPWLFNKHIQICQNLSLSKIIQDLEAIFLADLKLKNRSLGAETILGELAYRLAA